MLSRRRVDPGRNMPGDQGSMLVFTVFVGVAITAAALGATVSVIDHLHAHQQAQNAADAAALAGVTGGRAAAVDVAARNGAVLVAWSESGRVVTVVVSVESRSATARATDSP